MGKYSLIKQVGKGAGAVALAVAGALFAVYVRQAFGGWAFAVSLLLAIASSIPMVLFFNLFADPNAKRRKKPGYVEEPDTHDLFKDSFNHFYTKDKDD